ncbi:MAG: archaeoflavoprotein AfpA [Candidatus Thorarchaeota archaeon]
MIKILWGITGSGNRIQGVLDIMVRIQSEGLAKITVIISKAGEQVLRLYKLWEYLHKEFEKVTVETNANVPFVAGPLQVGKYDLFIVAPLTANSTAKIPRGIADTLITNAVAQTLKGETKVILYPVDQTTEDIETVTPDGVKYKIRARKIDLENTDALRLMPGVSIVSEPDELIMKVKQFTNSFRNQE